MNISEFFNEEPLKNWRKCGEGISGEVFQISKKIIKIIPIEGKQKMSLYLREEKENNNCNTFVLFLNATLLKGEYPPWLIKLWDKYNEEK
ncbi:putative serine/threonine-protein kinase haspin-like protein, partial [Armadillidium vulgare]